MQKLIAKRAIKTAAAAVGLGRIRSARSAGSVNIFAYHRVVADIQKAEQMAYHGLVVSTETFRHHCELLKEMFDVVSLDRAYGHLVGKRPSHRPLAVITFDDGYRDFYEQAFPVLRSLELTATVFLPTAWVGKDLPLDHDRLYWLLKRSAEEKVDVRPALQRAGVPDGTARKFKGANLATMTELLVFSPILVREKVIAELQNTLTGIEAYPDEHRLLDWDQIREMAEAGIDFGAHTANHVLLTAETADAAAAEIRTSKVDLETRLGREVTAFAYPNGEFTPTIRQEVVKAGFKLAVTTKRHINRPGCDRYALGRFSLCEESTRGVTGRYSEKIGALRLGA